MAHAPELKAADGVNALKEFFDYRAYVSLQWLPGELDNTQPDTMDIARALGVTVEYVKNVDPGTGLWRVDADIIPKRRKIPTSHLVATSDALPMLTMDSHGVEQDLSDFDAIRAQKHGGWTLRAAVRAFHNANPHNAERSL